MEIRQLRHFLALMESRSYWRAAEKCGLTSQALSKSIRRFEESLGVRLFDRDSRSVRPTLFADRIAAYAHTIDAEARSLRRELDQLLGTGTNQLTVGTGATAATNVAAEAILAVREKNPKLAVTVMEGTFESLIPQLVLGRLDVVVSIMTGEVVDPLVEFQILHVDQYLVFAGPKHPLIGHPRVSLDKLLNYPWVAGLDRDLVMDEVRASFEKQGLTPPRPQYRTDSLSFGISLVRQSNALVLLPKEMARPQLEAGHLAIVDVDAEPWTRPTVAFFRRNSTRSPDSVSFLKELRRIVTATG